jgi:hypothetical protein
MLIDEMDVNKIEDFILRGNVQSVFLRSYFVSPDLEFSMPSIVLSTSAVLVTVREKFRSGRITESKVKTYRSTEETSFVPARR